MNLPDRKKKILKAIVESYISTAEPVGSKAISEAFSKPISSATIRNEMGELEELGYLEKPHISAGRVPSYMAYRLYVNELMERYRIANSELDLLRANLHDKMREIDNIILNASRIVSEITNQAAVSMITRKNSRVKRVEILYIDGYSYAAILVTENDVKSRVFKLEGVIESSITAILANTINLMINENRLDMLLASVAVQLGRGTLIYRLTEGILDFINDVESEEERSEVYVEGASRLLSNKEYQDADRARTLLEYLSDRQKLHSLAFSGRPYCINIKIGPENKDPCMRDASFVFSAYDIDEHTHGIIGVIAPTRMDYAHACAQLAAFLQAVSDNTLPQDREIK